LSPCLSSSAYYAQHGAADAVPLTALEGREDCWMDCLTVEQPGTKEISDSLSGDQQAARLARQVPQKTAPSVERKTDSDRVTKVGTDAAIRIRRPLPSRTLSPPGARSTTLANTSCSFAHLVWSRRSRGSPVALQSSGQQGRYSAFATVKGQSAIFARTNVQARLTLCSRTCDLVRYDRRAWANMKSARALKSWRVLVRDPAMLSHVLRPRFNHKILDVPAGLRDIREQAPEYCSVTVPDRSQRVHGVSKICSSRRVDLVFDGDPDADRQQAL
jgi:hypothetical protein